MLKHNYLQAFYLSFFSKDFYRSVGQNWRGTGLLYILVLLALCMVINALQLQRAINYFVQHIAPPIIAELPEMQVTNGQLTAKADMPYRISDPSSGKAIAVIDTTGKITDLTQAQAPFLLTANTVFYQDGSGQVRELALTGLPNFKLNKANAYQFLAQFKQKAIFYVFGILLINFFFLVLVLILLFSIFAVICAKQLKVELGYKALFRLTAVGLTPVILVFLISGLLGLIFLQQKLVLFFLGMAYVYFAVRANQQSKSAIMVTPA